MRSIYSLWASALYNTFFFQASKRTQTLIQQEKMENITAAQSQENYRKAVNAGLKKILSKMGISLLSSYHGAQIFEIYGLGEDVVDLAFKGTVSRIGKKEEGMVIA